MKLISPERKSTNFLVSGTYQEPDYLCLNLIYIVVKTKLTFLENIHIIFWKEDSILGDI